MGLMDPVFLANLQSARPSIFPVLGVTWPGLGLTYYSSEFPAILDANKDTIPLKPRVINGGWGDVAPGVSERPSDLSPVLATVTLADMPDIAGLRHFLPILEGSSNPRKSPAWIKWYTPGAAPGQNEFTLFTGILDGWDQPSPMSWTLNLRTNDVPLQSYVPRWSVMKGAFPGAPATSLGLYLPWVYGIHDSQGLQGQGALPTVCVSLDATLGYRYVVSVGALKAVPRVYKNDNLQTLTTHYTIDYPTIGGVRMTRINMVSATTASDKITCDVEGLTTDAWTTGNVILNPVEQIKHFMVNQVWGQWKTGSWLPDSTAPLNTSAWTSSVTFAQDQKYEGSLYVGGSLDRSRGIEEVNKWLKSHPMMRMYWTNEGLLACKPIRFKYPGVISWPWARERDEIGATFKYGANARAIINQVSTTYLPQQKTGGLTQSLDIKDQFAQELVVESIARTHSSARFQ